MSEFEKRRQLVSKGTAENSERVARGTGNEASMANLPLVILPPEGASGKEPLEKSEVEKEEEKSETAKEVHKKPPNYSVEPAGDTVGNLENPNRSLPISRREGSDETTEEGSEGIEHSLNDRKTARYRGPQQAGASDVCVPE